MKKHMTFKKLITLLIVLMISCNDESEETIDTSPPLGIVDTVQNLNVEDIGDKGNGSDLLVRFDRIVDESFVDGYEIIIVQDDGEGFDLEDADTIPDENLTFIKKNGNDIEIQLDEDTTDSEGSLIGNNTDYTVFVVSEGAGEQVGVGPFIINALSEGVSIRLE